MTAKMHRVAQFVSRLTEIGAQASTAELQDGATLKEDNSTDGGTLEKLCSTFGLSLLPGGVLGRYVWLLLEVLFNSTNRDNKLRGHKHLARLTSGPLLRRLNRNS